MRDDVPVYVETPWVPVFSRPPTFDALEGVTDLVQHLGGRTRRAPSDCLAECLAEADVLRKSAAPADSRDTSANEVNASLPSGAALVEPGEHVFRKVKIQWHGNYQAEENSEHRNYGTVALPPPPFMATAAYMDEQVNAGG